MFLVYLKETIFRRPSSLVPNTKRLKRTLIYFTMDTQYQSFCFRFFSSSSLVDKFADNPFLQVGVFCFLFFNGLRLNSLLWSGHRALNRLAVRRRITDSRPSKFHGSIYDILSPTTAIVIHAVGLYKRTPN